MDKTEECWEKTKQNKTQGRVFLSLPDGLFSPFQDKERLNKLHFDL